MSENNSTWSPSAEPGRDNLRMPPLPPEAAEAVEQLLSGRETYAEDEEDDDEDEDGDPHDLESVPGLASPSPEPGAEPAVTATEAVSEPVPVSADPAESPEPPQATGGSAEAKTADAEVKPADAAVSDFLSTPPAESLPWAAPVPGSRRKPIIPAWAPFAGLGALVVVALIVLLAVLAFRADVVRVPSLVGLDRAAAAARLQEVGLTLTVGDRRFSADAPVDRIVDQSPKPGTKVNEGTKVTVAISAGSESFAMPDVVGALADAAQQQLKDRGLVVEIEKTVAADKPDGTVLASYPSAGETVATGDTVRLTVASKTGADSVMLPSDLTGKVFVLDPAPMPAGSQTDATMDIARRIRALLEASGATVRVTRDVTASGAALSTEARTQKARESSGTALIGFVVTPSGVGGLGVLTTPATSTASPNYATSQALGTSALDDLKQSVPMVTTAPADNDVMLTSVGIPALRIRLGSSSVASDRLLFSDPQWADDVARAVYKAIGSVYGSK